MKCNVNLATSYTTTTVLSVDQSINESIDQSNKFLYGGLSNLSYG